MEVVYQELKNALPVQVWKEVLEEWKNKDMYELSVKERENCPDFVFYEGPPSANGTPGIHHVLARTFKDIICRYKTMQGFKVERKAGWDTHGLPVELQVEKELGITRYDIGKKISIEDFNKKCRETVMRYKKDWEYLTEIMGFWINMKEPYITFDSKYIESVWYILKTFYERGFLYRSLAIVPYSPAAGTPLSHHELNLPGCYKEIEDPSLYVMFKVIGPPEKANPLFGGIEVNLLAWTTTPWTLPSNVALVVHPSHKYSLIKVYHKSYDRILHVILMEKLIPQVLANVEHEVIRTFLGQELTGLKYEPLFKYVNLEGRCYEVVAEDFVSDEEGTGIVHCAPAFGEEDFEVYKKYNLAFLCLVNEQGKFTKEVKDFHNEYVRSDYINNPPPGYIPIENRIIEKLKKDGKVFKVGKYRHNYPHCWRTDKPIIYYPWNSWFIKVSEFRDRLCELNKQIRWQPEYAGHGRFANWLQNAKDWNITRSRYWGIPIPAWIDEAGNEIKFIGSFQELKYECEKSVRHGFMPKNPLENFNEGDYSVENYLKFDPHRPFVDEIILVSSKGTPMKRIPDVIDVWFDSGAMPYAQLHYPWENKELFENKFPAHFIAEGMDQTRGWFYTLHVISTLLFNKPAFKSVISHGLVLDSKGQKMSKRLGNVVDPFSLIQNYGADPIRCYLISSVPPGENILFNEDSLKTIINNFFRAFFNSYNFFATYANIDNFIYVKDEIIPIYERNILDQWIISRLNSLIKKAEEFYENYIPSSLYKTIEQFVVEELSNWYIRLNRKRFWHSEYNKDKIAAYQTLYEVLLTLSKIIAPIAPFTAEKIYLNLTRRKEKQSVHLEHFPKYDETLINKTLENEMEYIMKVASLILSLRKEKNIKVRQPLSKCFIYSLEKFQSIIQKYKNLIMQECNIKEILIEPFISAPVEISVKPNYKVLGPRLGEQVKSIANALTKISKKDIISALQLGNITVNGITLNINNDLEIKFIPQENVKAEYTLAVSIDPNIDEELYLEGISRELVNRVQTARKNANLHPSDRILLTVASNNPQIKNAIQKFRDYIKGETLALKITFQEPPDNKLIPEYQKFTIEEADVLIRVEKAQMQVEKM